MTVTSPMQAINTSDRPFGLPAEIVVTLPMPPSVNELFFNVSETQRTAAKIKGRSLPGRLKSEKYRSWLNHAGWELKVQRQQPIHGPVAITYVVPDEGGCDLGNLEKATTDLLVRHGLIDGDGRKIVRKIVRKIAMEWSRHTERVQVTVRACV